MNLAQNLRQRLARIIAMETPRGRGVPPEPRFAAIEAGCARNLEKPARMAGDVEFDVHRSGRPGRRQTFRRSRCDGNEHDVRTIGALPTSEAERTAIDLVELQMGRIKTGFEMYGADWCAAIVPNKKTCSKTRRYLPYTKHSPGQRRRARRIRRFASLNIDKAIPRGILPNGDSPDRRARCSNADSPRRWVRSTRPTNDRRSTDGRRKRVGIGSPLHIPVRRLRRRGRGTVDRDRHRRRFSNRIGHRCSLVTVRCDWIMEGYDAWCSIIRTTGNRWPGTGRAELAERRGVYDALHFAPESSM